MHQVPDKVVCSSRSPKYVQDNRERNVSSCKTGQKGRHVIYAVIWDPVNICGEDHPKDESPHLLQTPFLGAVSHRDSAWSPCTDCRGVGRQPTHSSRPASPSLEWGDFCLCWWVTSPCLWWWQVKNNNSALPCLIYGDKVVAGSHFWNEVQNHLSLGKFCTFQAFLSFAERAMTLAVPQLLSPIRNG